MIQFSKIRWKNLLSTGNEWIEIDLAKNPMTLLIGVNGAGKSTLLDALTYNLFGKAYRNINLPQLVNSINLADCVTESEFRIGPNQYLVRRGMKPSIFEIIKNGKLIEQEAAKKDYQRVLEKDILGMSLHAFKQIVIVGTDGFVPFMRLDASDRRMIIENLLDIDIFSRMNEILKERVKVAEAQLDDLRIQIDTTMQKIDIQKKSIAANKKSTDSLIADIQNAMDTRANAIAVLEQSITQLQAEYEVLAASLVDQSKVSGKIRKIDGFRAAIQQSYDRADRALQFFEGNDNCDRCSQPLANKDEMVEKLKQELGEFGNGLNELSTKANELEQRLSELNEIAAKADDVRMRGSKLVAQAKALKQQQQQDSGRVEQLKAQPISTDIMEVSQQLFDDLQRLNSAKAQMLQLNKTMDIAAMLLKDNGIKSQIIAQYLPVINSTVNKYLNDLDFFVDFNIDSEFKETIKSRHRDTFSYENFSAGQKRRIDLALLFTWRAVSKLKNSVDTNILILDEVLDGSLDADGLEEFMKLLSIFTAANNAFVISHRGDVLADKFEHVLKFALAGNFTEIEEE